MGLNSRYAGMIIFGITLVLGSMSAWGQLYKYKDDQGRLHFTDDYLSVPEDQRPKFEVEESGNDSELADVQKADEMEATEDRPGNIDSKHRPTPSASRIRKEQTELAVEYKLLVDQRAQLETNLARTNRIRDREAYAKLYQQVQELNTRIKLYTERREKLDQELQAYAELINTYNAYKSQQNNGPISPQNKQ